MNQPLHDFAQNQIWCAIVNARRRAHRLDAAARPARPRRPPLGTQTAPATAVHHPRHPRPHRPTGPAHLAQKAPWAPRRRRPAPVVRLSPGCRSGYGFHGPGRAGWGGRVSAVSRGRRGRGAPSQDNQINKAPPAPRPGSTTTRRKLRANVPCLGGALAARSQFRTWAVGGGGLVLTDGGVGLGGSASAVPDVADDDLDDAGDGDGEERA